MGAWTLAKTFIRDGKSLVRKPEGGEHPACSHGAPFLLLRGTRTGALFLYFLFLSFVFLSFLEPSLLLGFMGNPFAHIGARLAVGVRFAHPKLGCLGSGSEPRSPKQITTHYLFHTLALCARVGVCRLSFALVCSSSRPLPGNVGSRGENVQPKAFLLRRCA